MTSFAMTTQGFKAWVPLVGSPTVALLRWAESCRKPSRGVVVREILPRMACIAALGTALMESFNHAVICGIVCAGLTGRILLRVTNRALAGAIGATWGFVYGGAVSFSPSIWLRRVVIYGYFLSRDITVVWRHFLERFVAAGDFAWLGVRMWDLSGRLDVSLEKVANVKRAGHHCSQSWEFLTFAITNVMVSLIKPQKTILSCKKQGLGGPIPSASLARRAWQLIWKNKSVTLVAVGALAVAADYFLICKASNLTDFWENHLPRQGGAIKNAVYDYTFGRLTTFEEDHRRSIEIGRVLDCLNLRDRGFSCPPGYLPDWATELSKPPVSQGGE